MDGREEKSGGDFNVCSFQFQMEYLGMHQQQQSFLPPYQLSFPHSDLQPPPGSGGGPPMSDKGTEQWGDPHDKHVSGGGG